MSLAGWLVALAAAQASFSWDVPEQTSLVEVAGETSAAGMPMKLHVATTRLAAGEVLAHYAAAFERAGFYLPPPVDQLKVRGAAQLSAIDPERLLAYMVIARPLAGGRGTKLLLSVAAVEAPAKPAAEAVFPGASPVLTTHGEGSRTLTYSVDAGAAEVEAFHAAELERRGFRRTAPDTFESKDEVVRLRVTPGLRGVTVLRQVTPQLPASHLKSRLPP